MSDSTNNHLGKVVVKGFKSIKNFELEIKPINILIGANGSGKSNFISLFTFLRHLSEGKLQNYVQKHGSASAFFHFGPKKTKEISIDIDVGYNGYHATFGHGINDDTLIFNTEYCSIRSSSKSFSIQGTKGESGLAHSIKADSHHVKKYTKLYLNDCRVYHFHDTSDTAGFKQACDLDAVDYLYTDASNIAAFLYYLKHSTLEEYSNAYLDIVEAIQNIAPYFHDFYLEPRGSDNSKRILLKWLHKQNDEPFSANQLSDGTIRFICMATLFLQPETLRPKTIILDEPELGLHPAALDELAEIVKVTSKDNQVICSTQSVTFANKFNPDDFIVVDQNEGKSEFKRVSTDELSEWLDDFSMGDIWSKNLIGGRPEW